VEFRLTGPSITYCVACASSAVAIGEAMRAIRLGVIDWAVAGGSEASLTRGILAAWAPLRTLAREDPDDPARSCKPFSVERSGFVLGEGAAALIVENAERAKRRQARVYAELAGYAVTSDGTHISDPSPDGQARAIRMALDDAEISPGEVGYLNAHGTATLLGDRVETVSLKRALGSHVAEVPVSSTKAVHGHVMGATGAIEAIAAILALHSGSIPPTAHLDQPSPDLDLDYVPNTARYGNALSAVVSNSFGFGGTNAVLVARNPAARLAPTQG
jgi:3-oxoacyl-[acyl-carrier-protein] synthase II